MDSTNLIIGLVFGSIGLGYFIFGRKQGKMIVRYCGIALMLYPYFISNTIALVLVGLALLVLPRFIEV